MKSISTVLVQSLLGFFRASEHELYYYSINVADVKTPDAWRENKRRVAVCGKHSSVDKYSRLLNKLWF